MDVEVSSVSFVDVGQSLVYSFKFIQKSLSIYQRLLETQKSMFYLKYGFICFTFCAVNCFLKSRHHRLSAEPLHTHNRWTAEAKTVILPSGVCWLRDTAASNGACKPIRYVKPWSLLPLSAEQAKKRKYCQ